MHAQASLWGVAHLLEIDGIRAAATSCLIEVVARRVDHEADQGGSGRLHKGRLWHRIHHVVSVWVQQQMTAFQTIRCQRYTLSVPVQHQRCQCICNNQGGEKRPSGIASTKETCCSAAQLLRAGCASSGSTRRAIRSTASWAMAPTTRRTPRTVSNGLASSSR